MADETVAGLDIAILEAVLDIGDTEARVVLARQLTALIAADDTAQVERDQVLPILLKLAIDAERDVRASLAGELVGVAKVHADLLFSIAADEDDIAIPFLEMTPALNPWHMLAILRVGDETRQSAIAGRADLSAEAASYVVKSASLDAALALLNNSNVKLEAHDLRVLYSRFGQSGEVVERLLALPKLPPDIRITQTKRAAIRMRQLIEERDWLPTGRAADLATDAEETAVLQVLIEADDQELLNATAFLATKNMLLPSLIVRAACIGEMRVVEAALCHLASLSPQRATAQMYSRGGLGMKSLVNKCGLPTVCAGLLVAAADVVIEARDEGVMLGADAFGRRLLEALMTRYEMLSDVERARQIEYVGRFAEERVRKIALQLKADIQRAA